MWRIVKFSKIRRTNHLYQRLVWRHQASRGRDDVPSVNHSGKFKLSVNRSSTSLAQELLTMLVFADDAPYWSL